MTAVEIIEGIKRLPPGRAAPEFNLQMSTDAKALIERAASELKAAGAREFMSSALPPKAPTVSLAT